MANPLSNSYLPVYPEPIGLASTGKENLMAVLTHCDAREIFSSLNRYSRDTPIDSRIYKMAAKRLTSSLDVFTPEEIINIIQIFVACDCTQPVFLEKLLQRAQQLMQDFKACEIVDLLSVTEKLEECKAKTPPNQLLVTFLQKLQFSLYERLQNEKPLVENLRDGLNKETYPPSLSEGLLKALLLLGELKPRQLQLQLYRAQTNVLKTKLTTHSRLSPQFLANMAIFFSNSVKGPKSNFYSDPGHKVMALKLQCEVNALTLKQRSDVVASYAKARIRDRSLLRTFARKFSHLGQEEIINNLPLITRHLESYAKLGYPNQNIFEIAYKMIVLAGIHLPKENILESLYGTIMWGASPGTISIKKIKQLYLAITPHVNPAVCNDWMRYELIERFSSILFPKPTLPALTQEASDQLKKEKASTVGVISRSQRALADYLVSEGEEVECEVLIDDYPYPVDIVIRRRKLIIEMDGPQHYDVSGESRLGKEFLKDYLLTHSGWNMEHVKFWEKMKTLDHTAHLNRVKAALLNRVKGYLLSA